MEINGLRLAVSADTILSEIISECLVRGLPYFGTPKNSADNIMVKCPFHKGGMERKPSFGIERHTMVCHCFTCGYSGRIDEVISEIFNHSRDSGEFGRRWLSSKFLSFDIATRSELDLAQLYRKRAKDNSPRCLPFTEQDLDEFRWYHDYMFERGLTEEVIEKFDVGYDHDTDSITFPVYHVDGSPAFIARRSITGKMFNYPASVDKPVYAADKIMQNLEWAQSYENGVLIVESIFNCLTAWKFGWPSVSLLGLGSAFQYEIIKALPIRKFTLGLDPDCHGRRADARIRNALFSDKIFNSLEFPDSRDINDLDYELMNLSIVL